MGADEANDVTKVLAAFGAPAIRYRSFGQRPVQLSRVVVSHRDCNPSTSESALSRAPNELRPQALLVLSDEAPNVALSVSRGSIENTVAAGALFINPVPVVVPRQMVPPRSSVAASVFDRGGLAEVFRFLADGPAGAALVQHEVPELLQQEQCRDK